MQPEVVVDVGTYRGLSASWMARAVQENGHGHVYAIDNFSLTDHESAHGPARDYLEANLKKVGVRDYVTIIDGDTDKVKWPDKVDFAYVDAWHSYHAAKYDFNKCASLGAECVCFDDVAGTVGPRMLIEEIRQNPEWDVVEVLRHCGFGLCMRKKEKCKIGFSQEIPDIWGVDLTLLTYEEQQKHLDQAALITGLDYSPVRGMIYQK